MQRHRRIILLGRPSKQMTTLTGFRWWPRPSFFFFCRPSFFPVAHYFAKSCNFQPYYFYRCRNLVQSIRLEAMLDGLPILITILGLLLRLSMLEISSSSTHHFRSDRLFLLMIQEFDYTAGDHNVIEVNHTDFRTCNQSRPVVKYTSGNDSITINKRGHYYFICGTPSHCEDGQKVDIRVVPESSKQSTTPSAPAPSNGNRVCTVSFMALLGKAATAALVIFHGFTY
ncbi:hypothetical protein C5167_025570 [Papaver somniferum]|uniref:Phytocyanin domain-containing protein n=1 Tax=Papaver somniferum TaxID=3469 RepID=A0A4Y7JVS9_PAPSO|nr:hypothetical protein C5167_025570 [Papaver somniferum]